MSTHGRSGVGNTRLRHVCFTYNNYPDDVDTVLREICTDPRIGFCVYQRETAPETKTLHLQGYLQFTSRVTWNTVKSLLPDQVHFEATRGKADEARNYCIKEDTRTPGTEPVEIGLFDATIGSQGKRSDLIALKRKLDEGKDEAAISRDDETFSCWVKYPNLVKRYRAAGILPRDRAKPPDVTVLIGPTGTGKTRGVFEFADTNGYRVYMKDNTQWWDGYEGQECICLDEFNPKPFFCIEELLRLLDRYPYQGQIKGSYVNINSPNIFITSNMELESHYANLTQEQLDALNRRITNKIHLN